MFLPQKIGVRTPLSSIENDDGRPGSGRADASWAGGSVRDGAAAPRYALPLS